MTDHDPEAMAEAAADLAQCARLDLDRIYEARRREGQAFDVHDVHLVEATAAVSRALAAAASSMTYVRLAPGRDVEGCTDCEPGDDDPETVRRVYRCRWCGDDLSDRVDPVATEASCVYRIGGGARHGGCTATILVSDDLNGPSTLIACTQDAEHEGQHIGVLPGPSFSHVVWSDGDRLIHLPTGAVDRSAPATITLDPQPREFDVPPGREAFYRAPSPAPFDDCGEVCPVVLAPRGITAEVTCRRITGHPGEHQGTVDGCTVRWSTDGVSVRAGGAA